MLLSKFFAPVLRNISSDSIISHQYLMRAGFIRQLASGIYNWLPLGTMVLKKIEKIICEEMHAINGMQIIMPCIQPASLWQESGRYDAYGDEMLRMQDRHKKELLFGPTHEEVVSDIFRNNVFSYKSLPLLLYQVHWKFRDEIRPRFGVMRSREFYMKDGYSFDIDQQAALVTYKKIFTAYMKIFKRLGLSPIAVRADSGSIGGGLSHEFHIAAETGESTLFYDKALKEQPNNNNDFETLSKYYTAADDKHDPTKMNISAKQLQTCRGIEVGHIFYFDTKYSKAMNFTVPNQHDQNIHPHMGSYGIGVSRLVGAIVEAWHDNNGIIWPEAVAPFQCMLINMLPDDELACSIYNQLLQSKIDVLYDDSNENAGSKFRRAQLIGLPWLVIVGKQATLNNEVELEHRHSKQKIVVHKDNIAAYLQQNRQNITAI